ncbi:NUDIX domain-containing protein [Providencia sp. PROV149]|uniref:NUDIX domain-containing protein n=1 Tax=Providencia sp. PROV149 TaxID=2949859 RepID=UPI00234A7EB9|nr:NUDIX domain-containing protein [Providencia sp. PROV149]
MINYVTGFMYSPDATQVVLIKKCQPEWQKGKFNGVGGKIHQGETPEEAMRREFLEETGVMTAVSDWRCFLILTNPDKYRIYMFSTYSEQFTQVKTVEKEEVSVHHTASLPKNKIANLAWLIPLSQDQKIILDTPLTIDCR